MPSSNNLKASVAVRVRQGAYYCYCNTFRSNPDRRVPMHLVIKSLKEYHKKLGLHIDMYHLRVMSTTIGTPSGSAEILYRCCPAQLTIAPLN
jgi:hypothetical protein